MAGNSLIVPSLYDAQGLNYLKKKVDLRSDAKRLAV